MVSSRIVFVVGTVLCAGVSPVRADGPLDFNRDVRPILADTCFRCHGPDRSNRKGDLRLDEAASALEDRGGHAVIVPGRPEVSTLITRITEKNPRRRMPPESAPRQLQPEQIAVLKRWIAEGGKYAKHWAYEAPVRPDLPQVAGGDWVRRPVDRFVLARLEKAGMAPSPEADPVTLMRRVSLDLTGLPPSPAEVDAYLAEHDRDPEKAYLGLVDRLLASPRYGERMAGLWLDAARYADSNGYQTDGPRTMWRWRDWVIGAFHQDLPFDRFTVEQLAGDLLPGATLDQKIASGFNRNHRGNSEGGIIPEEYAVEYVVDRVDTTATVWLGLTAGCSRCHDHKYDPLTQVDFYRMFAFFNNVPERGKAIKYGNSPPVAASPTPEQQVRQAFLEGQLRSARRRWEDLQPDVAKVQSVWEGDLLAMVQPPRWTLTDGLDSRFPLDYPRPNPDPPPLKEIPSEEDRRLGLGLKWVGRDDWVKGKIDEAVFLDGKSHLETAAAGDFGFFDRFTLAVWIWPAETRRGSILSRMAGTDRAEGYNVAVENGRIQVHLVKRWLDDAIRVETRATVAAEKWQHLVVSYDGSRTASGISVYLDGRPLELRVDLDDLNQSFTTKAPFRIGRGGGTGSHFRGKIDDLRIYSRVLGRQEAAMLGETTPLERLAAIEPGKRSEAQRMILRQAFLELDAPEEFVDAWTFVKTTEHRLAQLADAVPTTMVMEEMTPARATHVLIRGEYDKPGKRVSAGVPAFLPPLPRGVSANRLGFSRWVIDRSNPLTARVAVNRLWQMLFGTGLVRTVEDFGAQGEWPSHPDLLDWLAVEFMEPTVRVGGHRPASWSTKHLLRLLVTSAVYRQSSRVAEDRLRRDPDNRLLGRGPRVRLSARAIRDQALFAGGLLVEKIGGPSVKPYRPVGLAKELHGSDDYDQDHGPNLYRRSLYVHWRRTVAPPTLTNLDGANRETCVVRHTRTNTPLQALNLLNETAFVESARGLAQRVLREAEPDDRSRVIHAFRLATCRRPEPAELDILIRGLQAHREHYRRDPEAAVRLVSVGESLRDETLDVVEHASYTALANTLLNLDETITKE